MNRFVVFKADQIHQPANHFADAGNLSNLIAKRELDPFRNCTAPPRRCTTRSAPRLVYRSRNELSSDRKRRRARRLRPRRRQSATRSAPTAPDAARDSFAQLSTTASADRPTALRALELAIANPHRSLRASSDLTIMRDHDQRQAPLPMQAIERSSTILPDAVSRFPVGSSASSSFGSFASARAIATRCRSPTDSFFGKCFARCDIPTSFQQLGRLRSSLARTERRFKHRNLHVFQRRQCRQQVKRLKDKPQRRRAKLIQIRQLARATAFEKISPARGPIECPQQIEQRRFAAAAGPHDRDIFAAPNFERHVRQRLHRAVIIRAADIDDSQQRADS